MADGPPVWTLSAAVDGASLYALGHGDATAVHDDGDGARPGRHGDVVVIASPLRWRVALETVPCNAVRLPEQSELTAPF